MGIGTLGFLKGASKVTLDSIEAREEAERELKKQKQLEQFRANLRQREEMAKATTWLREDRSDGKSYMVGINSSGQRVKGAEREETADEATTRKNKGTLDTLTIEDKTQDIAKGKVDIENTRDTIRSRRDGDRRAEGLARAQTDYYDRGNQPSSNGNSGSGNKVNLSEVMDTIMTRNAKAIQELSEQEGVPLSTIQAGAWQVAEGRKWASPLELERHFSNYLTNLRKQAQKRGSSLDRYKKNGGDSDTTGR